jgi:hypothetical protein
MGEFYNLMQKIFFFCFKLALQKIIDLSFLVDLSSLQIRMFFSMHYLSVEIYQIIY